MPLLCIIFCLAPLPSSFAYHVLPMVQLSFAFRLHGCVSVALLSQVHRRIFSVVGIPERAGKGSMLIMLWQRLCSSIPAGSSQWCFSVTAAAQTTWARTWRDSREAISPPTSAGISWPTRLPLLQVRPMDRAKWPYLAWRNLSSSAARVRRRRTPPVLLLCTMDILVVAIIRAEYHITARWSPARSLPLTQTSTWRRLSPQRNSRLELRSSLSIRATRPDLTNPYPVIWTCQSCLL